MSECIGIAAHVWTLSINEANPSINTPPCGDECYFIYGIGDCHEWLTMPETVISVRMATDCPAYDTDDDMVPTGPPHHTSGYESGSHYIHHGVRCDCNWWPVARILAA